jgi:hypothetical protein
MINTPNSPTNSQPCQNWREFIITRILGFNGRTVGSLRPKELEALILWLGKLRSEWDQADQELRDHYWAIRSRFEAEGIPLPPSVTQTLSPQPSSQPNWREFVITCIEGFQGRNLGSLSIPELRSLAPWYETNVPAAAVDSDIKAHCVAIAARVQYELAARAQSQSSGPTKSD